MLVDSGPKVLVGVFDYVNRKGCNGRHMSTETSTVGGPGNRLPAPSDAVGELGAQAVPEAATELWVLPHKLDERVRSLLSGVHPTGAGFH
jgi:hypothetical protein